MKCNKCFVEKSNNQFNVNKRNKCGLQHYCKECEYKICRANRLKRKAQGDTYDEKYRINYRLSWGAGVYLITNLITKDTYVGQSSALRDRFNLHVSHGKNLKDTDVWKWEILEQLSPNTKILLERENYWINKIKPTLNINKN